MAAPWAIETERLCKAFGRAQAVRELDLRVQAGGITGFLGRNGAGKTTTLKMLLGQARPSAGTGRVLGLPIGEDRAGVAIRRRVAYVAEDKRLYEHFRVEELIRWTGRFYPDWRAAEADRLQRQWRLPGRTKVRALSKGMRTKLALLLALARRPELLILDEPSEGLDPVGIEELLNLLQDAAAQGTTVFFSSHQIAEVERVADRVCIVDRGRVVIDAPMQSLGGGYRLIRARFDGQAPEFGGGDPRAGRWRRAGRQISLLARDDAEEADVRSQLHACGASEVSVEPCGLREVFLDAVLEAGAE